MVVGVWSLDRLAREEGPSALEGRTSCELALACVVHLEFGRGVIGDRNGGRGPEKASTSRLSKVPEERAKQKREKQVESVFPSIGKHSP